MNTDELVQKYLAMTDAECKATLCQVLEMEVSPLDMVIAFAMILKPERVEWLLRKLKEHSVSPPVNRASL